MALKLQQLKPGVRKKSLLLLSASLWTVIGMLLVIKGLFRLLPQADYKFFIVILACIAAAIKSRFMLDRAAAKTIERILKFEDGTCLGAVYSIKTWLLVLCMITMGVILRGSSLPISFLSFVYLTIGLALICSSRHGWKAWIKCN